MLNEKLHFRLFRLPVEWDDVSQQTRQTVLKWDLCGSTSYPNNESTVRAASVVSSPTLQPDLAPCPTLLILFPFNMRFLSSFCFFSQNSTAVLVCSGCPECINVIAQFSRISPRQCYVEFSSRLHRFWFHLLASCDDVYKL